MIAISIAFNHSNHFNSDQYLSNILNFCQLINLTTRGFRDLSYCCLLAVHFDSKSIRLAAHFSSCSSFLSLIGLTGSADNWLIMAFSFKAMALKLVFIHCQLRKFQQYHQHVVKPFSFASIVSFTISEFTKSNTTFGLYHPIMMNFDSFSMNHHSRFNYLSVKYSNDYDYLCLQLGQTQHLAVSLIVTNLY